MLDAKFVSSNRPPPPPRYATASNMCLYTRNCYRTNKFQWTNLKWSKSGEKTFNCRDDSFLSTNSFRERSVPDKWIVSDNGNGVYDYVANAAHAICIPCGSHENKLLRKTVASMIIRKWNKFKNKGSGTFCLP